MTAVTNACEIVARRRHNPNGRPDLGLVRLPKPPLILSAGMAALKEARQALGAAS